MALLIAIAACVGCSLLSIVLAGEISFKRGLEAGRYGMWERMKEFDSEIAKNFAEWELNNE